MQNSNGEFCVPKSRSDFEHFSIENYIVFNTIKSPILVPIKHFRVFLARKFQNI